jgi:hypothetical protein
MAVSSVAVDEGSFNAVSLARGERATACTSILKPQEVANN